MSENQRAIAEHSERHRCLNSNSICNWSNTHCSLQITNKGAWATGWEQCHIVSSSEREAKRNELARGCQKNCARQSNSACQFKNSGQDFEEEANDSEQWKIVRKDENPKRHQINRPRAQVWQRQLDARFAGVLKTKKEEWNESVVQSPAGSCRAYGDRQRLEDG